MDGEVVKFPPSGQRIQPIAGSAGVATQVPGTAVTVSSVAGATGGIGAGMAGVEPGMAGHGPYNMAENRPGNFIERDTK